MSGRTINFINSFLFIALTFVSTSSYSQTTDTNTIRSAHAPISHCFHWLSEKSGYLTKKYNHAKRNNGDITFYTSPGTSNGAVAGPGLYCAKSPTGSYGYGDRVIRVDFVDDVVLLDSNTGRKYCGYNGNYYSSQAECNKKAWDVKFYSGGGSGSYAWYVIRNPQAVIQWSSNSLQVENDLTINKQYGDGGYDVHADNTIKRMRAERNRMGEMVIVNYKARMNLLDLLKDPAEVKKIPPLTLMARVIRYQRKDLSQKKKVQVYHEQAIRALNDIYLEYSDFQEIIDMDSSIQNIFVVEAKKVITQKDLHKVNVVSIMALLDKYDSSTITQTTAQKMWKAIFKSDNKFKSLVDMKFSSKVIQTAYFQTLPTLAEIDKIKTINQGHLLQLFEQYVNGKNRSSISSPYIKRILRNYMKTNIKYLQETYAGLTNNHLDKELIAISLIDELNQKGFNGMDPIYIGTFIEDNLKAAIKKPVYDTYIQKIKNLSLPVTDEETFKILSSFSRNRIKLPTFISSDDFLKMIFYRSLNEQSTLKSPTNTFRLVLSGYYEYFTRKIRGEKDDTKRLALYTEAETFFLNMASSLNGSLKLAYIYPLLQNASYFALNEQGEAQTNYDIHPVEKYFKRYRQGDANFDRVLENFTAASFDGSYLQFLAYEGLDRKNKDAKHLLSLMLASLSGSLFKNFRDTDEYELSNTEKEKWWNYIYNRHFANAGRNRAKSDFCGIADVLNKYSDKIDKVVTSQQSKELSKIISEGQKNQCF
jgi:hypothetical protein